MYQYIKEITGEIPKVIFEFCPRTYLMTINSSMTTADKTCSCKKQPASTATPHCVTLRNRKIFLYFVFLAGEGYFTTG